jgi:diguanylate cyclase (GGDEF)-like protein/PAS domain S-box-containing protein
MMTTTLSAFQSLLDTAIDAMMVVDGDGRITAMNLEAERVMGWPTGELQGEPLQRFLPSCTGSALDGASPDHNATPDARAAEPRVPCMARRKDGSECRVDIVRHRLAAGKDASSLLTLRVMPEVNVSGTVSFPIREVARAILTSIGDSVITTDLTGHVTYLNPVAERMTGWTNGEAQGQPLETVLPLIAESTRESIASTAERCLLEDRAVDLEAGVLLRRRDGTEIPIGDSAAPVRDRFGAVLGVVLVIQDESENRRVGHQLTYEATHDELTGLVNRREFDRRLARVVADLVTGASEQALLILDLDRFKAVNDSCGHEAGDQLLREVGPQLSQHLRARDTLARVGGDEFGILLENCPLIDAASIAECLRATIAERPFSWGGREFSIGVSIGLIPITAGSGGVAAVQRLADVACYEAKELGGNHVHMERRRAPRVARPPTSERRNGHPVTRTPTGHARLIAELLASPQAGPASESRPQARSRVRRPFRVPPPHKLAVPNPAKRDPTATLPLQDPAHD